MFWKGHLFFVVFNNKSTIIKTFLCTSNNHFIFKSLKKEAKQAHFRHLHLITIATLCYILLHNRYIIIMQYIAVTCCNSTPLLSDTSLYAILAMRRFCWFPVGNQSFAGDFGKVGENKAEVWTGKPFALSDYFITFASF